MAHTYRAVGWNRQKKVYDSTLAMCVVAFFALFVGASAFVQPNATLETLLIRGFGVSAFTLLHVVLCIGPLCRLDPRFLPLLYNRRHMGVTMFGLALAHGSFAFVQYHALGVLNPFVSLFVSDAGAIPFQPLGAAALAILFLMAATSHDFWLANLTAPVWKALHMLVYLAYALLVMHVSLGVLQSDRSPWLLAVVALGLALVLALHSLAALKERRIDRERRTAAADGFVDVCAVGEIEEKRARIVTLSGDRVAVFKYDGKISAVSNACRHQNGPLGEGRVIDGCITCPWHGYQYLPDTGSSPPPFTERVPTFDVRVQAERVLVHPQPHAAGTRVEPARCARAPNVEREFYVGYLPRSPRGLARHTRFAVSMLALATLSLSAVLALRQRVLRDSRFEFGVVRDFRGVLEARPYPMLRVARPSAEGSSSRYLLVTAGKHGAFDIAAPLVDQPVTLRGSLIFHDDKTMIEVVDGSLARDASAIAPLPWGGSVSLGRYTFLGEIVDSKCHLGVMNPGERATHRACAKLCIRGGIPPILWVEDDAGHVQKLLLVDDHGAAVNERVLELVGERVEITGEVVREGDWLVLKADPATYKRAGT
jgi:DMSO/TMAO reductase YedYZ heme-binding membrane subunit/nitrite reductase/ring-hydroxylating ferredoxin subunit